MTDKLVGGRYRIVREISRGGFAAVFLAQDERLNGMYVALKHLLPENARIPSVLAMFKDEIRISSLLSHHNIVQIRDQVQDGDDYFVVFEYVAGADLRHLIARLRDARRSRESGCLPAHVAAYVVLQVCQALDYAHNLDDVELHVPHGIIHRDISPENVLMTFDGDVKLADFGIAGARRQLSDATHAGAVRGKYHYMSPEQVRGQAVDQTTDVYALGSVLYEALTGEKLFQAQNDMALVNRVAKGGVRREQLESPCVPQELRSVLERALQPDPVRRFQSAREMALAIVGFVSRFADAQQELSRYIRAAFGQPDASQRDEKTEVVQAQGVVRQPASADPPERPREQAHLPAPGERTIIDIVRVAAYSGRRFFLIGGIAILAVLLGFWTYDAFSSRRTAPGRWLYFLVFPPVASVDTYPPGAEIRIDGAILGTTPLLLSRVAPGLHTLEARLSGYEDVRREVNIMPRTRGEVLPFVLKFVVPVDFVTAPEGAQVNWGGTSVGLTPVTGFRAEVGPDPVMFELSCPTFASLRGSASLSEPRRDSGAFLDVYQAFYAGSLTRWVVKGSFYAKVDVEAVPSNCQLTIDGKEVASNGGRVSTCLPYGQHEVRASRAGLVFRPQTVNVADGRPKTVRMVGRRRVTFVVTDVATGGPVSDLALVVDGSAQDASVPVLLALGPHRVVVRSDRYRALETQIDVDLRGGDIVNLRLERESPEVTIIVRDSRSSPASNVRVWALKADGSEKDLGYTDEYGQIVTTALGGGSYYFQMLPAGGGLQEDKTYRGVAWPHATVQLRLSGRE